METNNDKLYSASDATPAYPIHPGGILGEELKARGISQKQFAETIGLQATHLSALIHGSRNFTPAVAAKIESGLEGIPAALWMKLQENYNLDVQRKRLNPARLVTGYNPAQFDVQPTCLADPRSPYGGRIQVTLTIPESDRELLEKLDIPTRMLGEVKLPGTVRGTLLPEIARECGFPSANRLSHVFKRRFGISPGKVQYGICDACSVIGQYLLTDDFCIIFRKLFSEYGTESVLYASHGHFIACSDYAGLHISERQYGKYGLISCCFPCLLHSGLFYHKRNNARTGDPVSFFYRKVPMYRGYHHLT